MNQSSLSRRRVLGSAALVGVGGPLLAACAGGDEDDAAGSDAPAPDTGTGLAATADVPVGGGVILGDAKVVVTQPSEGEFKAFSATCTHQACLVTGVTETIDCTCHGSKFSLSDGSVAQGPATEPLPAVNITVKGDRIVSA